MDSDSAKESPGRTSGAARDTDVWVKWYWWSHYALYGFLIISTLMALFFGEPSWQSKALAVAIAGLLACWHWYFQGRSPQWYYSHIGIRVCYVAGMIAFFVALIGLYPDYWLLSFIVFWQIWTIASVIWSGTISLVFTLLLLAMQGVPLTGSTGFLNLGLVGIVATVSIVMGLYISSLIGQSEERQRLIGELEATRAELADQERRAGVLEERGRLAREIHDTLAQGFISIHTHLEASEESPPGSTDACRHVELAKQTSRENLAEARRLVAALRPEILEGSSLADSLRRLGDRTLEATGIPVSVNITGETQETPQELQVTLLRAAQEALANARRHAKATRIDLTLSYAEDLLLLDVQDDGVGFDPSSCASNGDGGFGLRSMRERVAAFGGELLVESEPGAGTTLAIQLPLQSLDGVLVHFVMTLAGIALLSATAALFLDLRMPHAPGLVFVAVTLSSLSFLAMGFALASLLPSVRVAQAVGQALFLPMFFISGAALPVEQMPPWLQSVSDYVPLSYAVRLVQEVWIGQGWNWGAAAVLLAVLALATLLTTRVFRWE